jgi:proteasome lid subunit RPN8/RPN11
VFEILMMRNADESEVSFSIEPPEVLRAYDLAESKRLQVIGIFHSHPTKPTPSIADRKFMEINPVIWLIYSSTEQKFSAYVYDSDVKEVAVQITA